MSASNPTEPQTALDGIFAIHKEAGWTSHDVVAKVRRIAHLKRVGHAGTLDPAATGVLPVCLGQATRVVEYLSDTGKAYRATITFGVETNTYDAEGEVTATLPVPETLDEVAIAAVLPQFLGTVMQVPPIFSALKHNGQRLYDLARAGVVVEMKPRPVRIDALTIVDWHAPTLVLDVACGKGTYIRSLAHDLGAVFGCGAHLAALVRTRVGPFALAQTITLDGLATAFAEGTWSNHFYAPDEALLSLPAAILAEGNEDRLRKGQPLRFPSVSEDEHLRAYATDGRFLGLLARRAPDAWQPDKVFAVTPLDDSL